jgi:hypothetical protein
MYSGRRLPASHSASCAILSRRRIRQTDDSDYCCGREWVAKEEDPATEERPLYSVDASVVIESARMCQSAIMPISVLLIASTNTLPPLLQEPWA